VFEKYIKKHKTGKYTYIMWYFLRPVLRFSHPQLIQCLELSKKLLIVHKYREAEKVKKSKKSKSKSLQNHQ